MVLCIEIGNTSIKIALFDETKDELASKYSLKSAIDESSDEYAIKLKSLIKDVDIEGAIISSVVPSLTRVLKVAVSKVFNVDAKILNSSLKTKIPIKIDNPKELGADFIATAVGGLKKYSPPFVVADLGTATKISVVDKNGALVGGIITAGMKISMEGLAKNAAQLYDVELVAPKRIIGKNSIESIQSGIVFGQAYMVSEFARRIENELGYKVERILTGGYGALVKNEIVCYHYEENLSLEGLYQIYLLNKDGKK